MKTDRKPVPLWLDPLVYSVIVTVSLSVTAFLMVWLCGAFIMWDIGWMFPISEWKPGERAILLGIVGIFPACMGTVNFFAAVEYHKR